MALIIAGVAFSIGRYAIRYSIRKSFYWDDLFHGVATLALIAYIPLQEGDKLAISQLEEWLVYMSQVLVFILGLWSVKFSFLFFLRLIFWVNRAFMTAWYVVAATTFLLFWIPVGLALPRCGMGHMKQLDTAENCSGKMATMKPR